MHFSKHYRESTRTHIAKMPSVYDTSYNLHTTIYQSGKKKDKPETIFTVHETNVLAESINSASKNAYLKYEANQGVSSRNKESMPKSMTDFCSGPINIQSISPIQSNRSRQKENSDSKPVCF
jgi:hypothetical protein